MSRRRTIAVFTGNRAEYGLQFPILKAIDAHPDLDYRLIVSGAHLDANFGRTLSEIQADGFEVHAEVKIDLETDTLYATAKAIGTGVVSMSQALDKIRPDLLVVYADRFEGFAAVIAGTQMGIPTAHVEGGDITEGGALDDSVRHAMTKLAHLHFTTNEEAAWRVRSMGEEAWRVFNVGFPAIDLITAGSYAAPEALSERYGIDLQRPVVVFTQHSVATQFDQALDQIRPALEAMEDLAKEGIQVILTYPNNDAGGKRIIAALEEFGAKKIPNTRVEKSLGRYNYHGFLNIGGRAGRGVCVGNSSSGIKETPAFGCPSVLIGSRQDGRLASDNVIYVPYDRPALVAAVKKSLFDEEFRRRCATCKNPYGEGDAGKKIAQALATIDLGPRILLKGMTLKDFTGSEV